MSANKENIDPASNSIRKRKTKIKDELLQLNTRICKISSSFQMDLSKIGKKFESNQYSDPWSYIEEFQSIIDNAFSYNHANTEEYRDATKVIALTLICRSMDYILFSFILINFYSS